jgi:hypothetical protein
MIRAPDQKVECANVTRLKNHLLAEVPGLCEQGKRKFVLLTLDGAIGKAVFEASNISDKSDSMIICKAANIIRKHMFSVEERFDGNLSTSR